MQVTQRDDDDDSSSTYVFVPVYKFVFINRYNFHGFFQRFIDWFCLFFVLLFCLMAYQPSWVIDKAILVGELWWFRLTHFWGRCTEFTPLAKMAYKLNNSKSLQGRFVWCNRELI